MLSRLVSAFISEARLKGNAARTMRRIAAGPQVMLERTLNVPLGGVTTDFTFENVFPAGAWVATDVFLEVIVPSTAGSYTVTVGRSLGGNQIMLAQAFPNPQSAGDTRGVLVAELGADYAAVNKYRALYGASVDVFVRIASVGVTGGGQVKLKIVGIPLPL
jgi:hypothetical protein